MRLLILLVWIAMVISIGRAERANKTASGGLFWSDEGDLEADESAHQGDELDGGFSSLDGMLQWAIGHSDATKLKDTAHEVQRLKPEDLERRQMEIKELIEELKMPSDAQLMQIAIQDLKNSSLPSEIHHRALQELLDLVEPVENAAELQKLGGLAVVVGELSNPDSGIRTACAWIIGKASQNNPVVQNQVLELGALKILIMMVKSSSFTEEATKALYAISALIRNNIDGQELFCSEVGGLMLQNVVMNSSIDLRLRKKSLLLVADLAESQLETRVKVRLPFLRDRFFLKSVVDLSAFADDLDLQEKTLHAIKSLLRLNEALVFKEFCGLDGALERTRQRLEENHATREYASEVENLRKEVYLIFHEKLNQEEVNLYPATFQQLGIVIGT